MVLLDERDRFQFNLFAGTDGQSRKPEIRQIPPARPGGVTIGPCMILFRVSAALRPQPGPCRCLAGVVRAFVVQNGFQFGEVVVPKAGIIFNFLRGLLRNLRT